jgi:ribulose-5-phosphate 4-epimerase/fuculose-1-phosphate aldolase
VTGYAAQRDTIIAAARSIFGRRLSHGNTGNISMRAGEHILVTPTGSSLGTVTAEDLSLIDTNGRLLEGRKPSKEAFLHAAMLRSRNDSVAVIHTHSTYSAAVSCLAGLDPDDALPPLTAYFAMRVGRLPLLPYFAPGDRDIEDVAHRLAVHHSALLLSNHGPIVAGGTMLEAMDALEELEETAKIFLLLQGLNTRPLTAEQRSSLLPRP